MTYELNLRVIEAKDVPKADIFGKSDPFCIISLTSTRQIFRTKVVPNTLNPVWNDEFRVILADPAKDLFQITVKDNDDTSEDDPLGRIKLKASDFPIGQVIDKWYELEPLAGKPAGSIHILVQILPKGTNDSFPPVK
jgi:Ca2+-dependent lipid-binding protein